VSGSIRDRLTIAAAQLREAEHYDSAAAVEAVLAPRGYRLLEEKRGGASNLSLGMTVQLKQALEVAGQEFDVVFSGLAEEALSAVLERGWVPPAPPRARQGTARARTVLNVSIDDDLTRQVRQMLPVLSKKAGYDVKLSQIVIAYICDELGVERPNTAGSDVRTRIPKTLMDHFTREAAARKVSLQSLVEDGIRELLAGRWVPERNPYFTGERGPRTRVWSEKDRAYFVVPLDPELRDGLRDKCDELSAEYGYLLYPGWVVRAILTDALGEPAE